MLMLAFLGFTNFAHSLPLNDKILHLVCLCLATTVFYFIFDVEEWVTYLTLVMVMHIGLCRPSHSAKFGLGVCFNGRATESNIIA